MEMEGMEWMEWNKEMNGMEWKDSEMEWNQWNEMVLLQARPESPGCGVPHHLQHAGGGGVRGGGLPPSNRWVPWRALFERVVQGGESGRIGPVLGRCAAPICPANWHGGGHATGADLWWSRMT